MSKSIYRVAFVLLAASLALGCWQGGDDKDEDIDVDFAETQEERNLEVYDARGPLESWSYDSTDALVAYAVYEYDASDNLAAVKIYPNDATVTDDAMVMRATYTYDAGGNPTNGKLQGRDASDATGWIDIESFDATWNNNNKYLTYAHYLKKSATALPVLDEYRVCAFDATEVQYTTESYYSDLNAIEDNLLERYTCTWDPNGYYTKEDYYYKIPSPDTAYTYERNLVYTYTWDDNGNMCYQTEYDEDGSLLSSIIVTYVKLGDGGWYSNTMTELDQNGREGLYQVYEYDSATYDNIELLYYDLKADAVNTLQERDSYRYFTRGDDSMYQHTHYVYDYSSRALGGRGLVASSSDRLLVPAHAHHHE